MPQRSGYIALLGRPNAGKSTLLNALVGEKLAVVSRKPQTTRNRILGVVTSGDTQMVFLDTPGMHQDKSRIRLNSTMNRLAMTVAADADLVLYLVDAVEGFTAEDQRFLSRIIASSSVPFVVLASKTDKLKREAGLAAAQQISEHVGTLLEALPEADGRLLQPLPYLVSAKQRDAVAELKAFIARQLPEAPWLFAADDLTDMSGSFVVSELVREQLFRQLGQEIPYGCAVKVEAVEEKQEIVVVRAAIILTRAPHKPIVLGKGGTRIKKIGTEARMALERYFEKKVFLDLNVKVVEGWVDDERLIAELAHLNDLDQPGDED